MAGHPAIAVAWSRSVSGIAVVATVSERGVALGRFFAGRRLQELLEEFFDAPGGVDLAGRVVCREGRRQAGQGPSGQAVPGG